MREKCKLSIVLQSYKKVEDAQSITNHIASGKQNSLAPFIIKFIQKGEVSTIQNIKKSICRLIKKCATHQRDHNFD